MAILIKGMDMPEFGALNIFVLPDGKVLGEVSGQAPLRLNILGTAVPVPTPHGRLIDADKLDGKIWEQRRNILFMDDTQKADMVLSGLIIAANAIEKSPTVIEAEEG